MPVRAKTSIAPAPSADEIRAQLTRIVESVEFAVPERGRAFLRYVVGETIEGRGDRIKAYSVAIEVFNRTEAFTQDDPVVRIEAGRLRRSLERYYLVAGQADPIRIDLPKGGYVPTFAWNAKPPAPPPAKAAAVTEPPPAGLVGVPAHAPLPGAPDVGWSAPSRLGRFIPAAIGLALVCVGVGAWSASPWGPPSSEPIRAAVPDRPTLVVVPFADLGGGPEAKVYALGLTEELLSELPRFKELTVFGRETSESLATSADSTRLRNDLGARYLLTGGVQVDQGRVHVTARLVETATSAILWSQSYDNILRSGDLFAIQSDVAGKVASAVAQPYGIIFKAAAAEPAKQPPDDLEAYLCTLSFYGYRAQLSVEKHALLLGCLERAVARFPSYATAWAMLSIAYLDEDRFAFNHQGGSQTPLERSLDAAQRAVQLEPENIRALQALMTALFFNQKPAKSLAVGKSALVLNPNDTELMGEFGTRLAMAGQWSRGADLLKEALARNPGGSGFYRGTLALAAYMQGDSATALREIQQANLKNFPLYHVVAAIIYADAGMETEATRERTLFLQMRPDFVANLDAELTKRNIQPADRPRLVAGLKKAGFAIPQS